MNGLMEKVGEILTEEDYDVGLQKVREIIKGKFALVIKPLREKMKACIKTMEFEKAGVLQQKLEFI